MKPAISVVISIYNEPEIWLRESIDSILNQTFSDFEFIIINDNPERELNNTILTEYQSKDKRIVIITNEVNIGLTKSLNIGIKIAKGKYLARMDADDIALPTRFEKQVNYLENNKEYVACGSRASVINEKGKIINKLLVPIKDSSIRSQFIIGNPMIHPSLMICKDVLKANKLLYDENLRYSQDYELIRNLLSFGKLHNLKDKLIFYRKSSKQISSANLDAQNSIANLIRMRLFTQQFKINNLSYDCNNFKNMMHVIKNNEVLSKEPLLKNSVISLILNSPVKIDFKHIFNAILFSNSSIKNRLRLIKHFLINNK